MSESAVLTDREGAVLVITINRPEVRNAVDSRCAAALRAAFKEFEAEENLFVAILTGAGGHFCAGADLKALARGDKRPIDLKNGPMGPTLMQLSKPVIAAVEGYAVGGGFELALFCDIRVAAEGAVFGVFNRRFGVPLVDGGTVRLPRLVGHGRAMDLILTGREVRAQEAHQIGLVEYLVPEGGALRSALELAHKIASFPQNCLRHDRLSAIEQWGMSEREALINEAKHGRLVVESGEPIAGALTFAEGKGRHGQLFS